MSVTSPGLNDLKLKQGGTQKRNEDVGDRLTSGTDRAELEAYRRQAENVPKTNALGLTNKQVTAALSVITLLSTALGGGGYLGANHKMADETTATDEANRRVVREELGAVLVNVNARVERDRKDFEEQLAEISSNVKSIEKKQTETAIDIAVIKSRLNK